MPYQVFDLNPVDRITTDAVGEPGRRVFYLQGRKGLEVVTLICEKEHVVSAGHGRRPVSPVASGR